jgi:para-nitrobenzyl esterase
MTRLALLPLAAVLACGEAPAPPPDVDPATRRELTSGSVVGLTNADGAHVWRGIPFARPPVGPLRWRAPRPPEPWADIREATTFGASCVQFGGLGRGEQGEPTGDEDCLVLNVFAPPFAPSAVPRGEARLPVMVWIHGGGNTVGSADIYESGRLALRQEVVVVTVHYRLGAFGWFRHPSLHTASDTAEDRSGNYGTLDLVRALEWVRDNASAFGGDPDRVTIFGESAGGVNVYSLLLSPRARGLFHRAISQSGLLMSSPLAEAENFVDAEEPGHAFSSSEVLTALLQARGATDRSEAKARLAAMSAEDTEQLLRGTPAYELLRLYEGGRFGPMYSAPLLFPDGEVLPASEPLRAFAEGHYNRVPVILGTNRDENKLFALFTSEDVTRLFGVPLWIHDERRYDLLAEYGSRMWKASGVDDPARAMRAVQGPSVYAYRFDWDEEPSLLWADFGRMLGAAHAVEIPFVLGHLDLGFANRFLFDERRRPAAEALSHAMMSYWGALAHDGAPGRGRSGALVEWRPWDATRADGPKYMVFDTDEGGGLRMSSRALHPDRLIREVERDERFRSRNERCEVYAGFVLWAGQMSEDEYARVADGACRAFPLERI